MLAAKQIDRIWNGQVQHKLQELEIFNEAGRLDLLPGEQHRMELYNVLHDLRVDAAVTFRMEIRASSRLRDCRSHCALVASLLMDCQSQFAAARYMLDLHISGMAKIL